MKVFASKFLSPMVNVEKPLADWSWVPANDELEDIYASGAPTNTSISTYAAEKDDHGDSDSPQEGMLVAQLMRVGLILSAQRPISPNP